MEIYARTSTIARTERLLSHEGETACARELAFTDLFCRESGLRFRNARNGLNEPDDATDVMRIAVAAIVRADHGYGSADAMVNAPVPPLPEFKLILGD